MAHSLSQFGLLPSHQIQLGMALPEACPLHRQQQGWESTVSAPATPSQSLGSTPGPAPSGCPVATSLHRHVVGLVEGRLQRSGRLRRYTLAEVARHDRKDDAWVAVDGKVSQLSLKGQQGGASADIRCRVPLRSRLATVQPKACILTSPPDDWSPAVPCPWPGLPLAGL